MYINVGQCRGFTVQCVLRGSFDFEVLQLESTLKLFLRFTPGTPVL